ncbi:glycosyltransferase family 1 protein [Succinimonas amylolytica]|uniref:glycosyltransferase family 1 protein n=1 Tax=Succinimonas amylolytica TaxID=83769 RepID=UPI00035E75C0|nr:glycosyltransferase family 1 protein [Succinimonas amylolytica]
MESNRPIRVAHIIGKLNAAGVESVVNNYYKFIDHSKYQFDFIIDSDGQCSPKQELINLGARYYIIPPYQNLIKHIIVLTRLLKMNNYQIVHSSMNTLAPISLFCAWLAGVPIRINHNHSTSSKGEHFRNIIKYLLRPFAKCFATNYAACSYAAAKWLFGREAVDLDQVKIINNAIDINTFRFDKNVRLLIRKELNLNNKFVIGHVGRFEHVKNHEFIIDLFKEFNDYEKDSVLVLVGIGSLMETIKNKVRILGLDNNVVFLGVRDDISMLYQAMDAFVLPSYSEGLGMVGIEAQSAGLPCIFSDQIPIEAVVVDENVLILTLDQIQNWKESLLKFKNIRRRDTSIELSNAGFNIEKEAKKLEDYYDKLINAL